MMSFDVFESCRLSPKAVTIAYILSVMYLDKTQVPDFLINMLM